MILAQVSLEPRGLVQLAPELQATLFFIVREGDPEVAAAALKPYEGTVRHISFPPEAEKEMRRILSKRI